MPPLTFTRATQSEPGSVYAILSACFAEILDAPLEQSLRQFDREVFANPDTVGACTLIASVADETIGLLSYDPRQAPQCGIIGYNGVLPPHRHQGYGCRQVQEIIRMLTARDFETVRVTTSLHPFFEPARRMYEACGFRKVATTPASASRDHTTVLYQMNLRAKASDAPHGID
jgi:RimJ/RimL family protein N-acetyltransferase